MSAPAPTITCCRPVMKAFPSGRAAAHRANCPIGRGQKLGNEPRVAVAGPARIGGCKSCGEREHHARSCSVPRLVGKLAANAERRKPAYPPLGDLEELPEGPRTSLRVWLDHHTGCPCRHCEFIDAQMEDS